MTLALNGLLLNAQDMFIFMDKYKDEELKNLSESLWQNMSISFYPNKPLYKLWSLKKIIEETNPHIIFLTEVGGEESLINLNKYFLDGAFDIFFAPSNSNRGIDTGILVKKKLAPYCKLTSYNKDILKNKKTFARGVLQLDFDYTDQNKNYQTSFLLTHLKSKLDLQKKDFEGRGQRASEVHFLRQKWAQLQNKYTINPVVILGDLNGIMAGAESEPELIPFIEDKLIDASQAINGIENSWTYVYYNAQNRPYKMQLDYCLLHESFQDRLISAQTKIYRYEDYQNAAPPSRQDRDQLPSDHYPYQFSLYIKAL